MEWTGVGCTYSVGQNNKRLYIRWAIQKRYWSTPKLKNKERWLYYKHYSLNLSWTLLSIIYIISLQRIYGGKSFVFYGSNINPVNILTSTGWTLKLRNWLEVELTSWSSEKLICKDEHNTFTWCRSIALAKITKPIKINRVRLCCFWKVFASIFDEINVYFYWDMITCDRSQLWNLLWICYACYMRHIVSLVLSW